MADASIDGVILSGTTAQHDGLAAAAARAKKHLFYRKTAGHHAGRGVQNLQRGEGIVRRPISDRALHAAPIRSTASSSRKSTPATSGTITRARHANCHSGALGGWFDKDYRWFFQKDQAGGGGFYDMGCHSADILVYFFGPIAAATAALAPHSIKYQNIDEYGEGLHLQFKSRSAGHFCGFMGGLRQSDHASNRRQSTEGHLTVIHGQLFYQSAKTKVPNADLKTPIDPKHFPPALPHAFELFLDVLAGKQPASVLIPVEDALNVAVAMDAMYQGHKLGAWVKV